MIWWNNMFPLDRKYREKYKIAFNSPQHRELSQIDIYLDIIEDELFNEAIKDAIKDRENAEQIEKGIWIRERIEVDVDDIFNKIDVGKFNNIKIQ